MEHHLAGAISCHAWSGDRSLLALCPNSSEVWILSGCSDSDSSKWRRRWVLKEHDMLVSGLDWHPATNRLVSVGHDRNAFVWGLDAVSDAWVPQVVVLNSSKAALDVKWSPDGHQFVVATGSKQALVCKYDAASNWWVSSSVKKAKSSLTACDWHPSGQLVATASTDFRCRVVAALLPPSRDDSGKRAPGGQPTPPPPPAMFGPLPEFGTELVDFEQGKSWVNDCRWAPSGTQLAFVTHDAHLHVAAFHPAAAEAPSLQSVAMAGLPASRLLWLSERVIVAAGHSPQPYLFVHRSNGAWALAGSLTLPAVPQLRATTTTTAVSSNFGAAKAMFAARAAGAAAPVAGKAVGAGEGSAPSSPSSLRHHGAVTYLQPFGRDGHNIASFSTTGVDGRLIVWEVREESLSMSGFSAADVAIIAGKE